MITDNVFVTKDLAVATFEQVIEELGGDTVIDTCQIYVGGYDGEEKLPSCAVGQVYYRLVDKESWLMNDSQAMPDDGWQIEGDTPNAVYLTDDTALGYLLRLQSVQDAGETWARAHEIAQSPETFATWREGLNR